MIPVEFKDQNKVFTRPQSMTEEECQDLPVCVCKDPNGQPVIISVWELEEQEKQQILKTGKVYLHIVGKEMPPVYIGVYNPFMEEIPRKNKLYLNTPSELAIHNAIELIEKEGASQELTEIVSLLVKAKDKLGDYIDK